MVVTSVAFLIFGMRCAGAQTTAPYNVILLTADQMSANDMQLYGAPFADTPNLDHLAAEGTVFTRMYAGAPWTTPSFGTILTGLFPTVHGMTLPPYEGCGSSISRPLTNGQLPNVPPELLLSPQKPILPEMLKPFGVITAADNANCWSIWDVAHRGWDSFKFFPGYQLLVPGHPGSSSFYLTAPKTTAWAQQWLKDHQTQRFFLWVHYMEPHAPFNEPAPYDKFKEPSDYPNLPANAELDRLAKLQDIHAVRRMQELYAGKILYADHYIGQLLDTVRELGLNNNTLIIFTSDHGELLYSHPRDFNTADHRSLYDTDLHVPLIVAGPGIMAGQRVDDLASNYDIVPTIMSLENLPPPARTDGVSLKAVLEGASKAPPNQYLFAEETNLIPQYSVRDSRYKLIETMRTGGIQCFDEATDWQELHSICAQIPAQAAALKAVLDQHIQSEIQQAKSYPDWQNNVALAVLEQRDSDALQMLSQARTVIPPTGGADYQLTGRAWTMDHAGNNFHQFAFWAPPGPADASVLYRSDTPFTGNYQVLVWYGGIDRAGVKQATNANYTVHYKGGSMSFAVNQAQDQGAWHLLGVFHDPTDVELTNRADGAVVAGAVEFLKTK
ncbi:MAG TPA: sulfatase-like hydrolase/transferase [Terriglobales bacterium]|nr:sulfatase-like hydrolase/transferase [Terriglobales bacterium]